MGTRARAWAWLTWAWITTKLVRPQWLRRPDEALASSATQLRGRRLEARAVGLSIAVHGALLLLILVGIQRPYVGPQAGDDEPSVVAVGLIEESLSDATNLEPSNLPPPTTVAAPSPRKAPVSAGRSVAAAPVPGTRGQQAALAVPRVSSIVSGEPESPAPAHEPQGRGPRTALLANKFAAETVFTSRTALDADRSDDDKVASPDANGGEATPVALGAGSRPDQPITSGPVFVSSDVATYLRSQDYFPPLPAALRQGGARYKAQLEICVATDGHVTEVDFRQHAAPDLDTVLRAAVRSWRYRPLMVNGRPAPFCHQMIVSYELG